MIAIALIAGAPETVQTIMSFFVRGGLFMWPLLICSIVSVTTMILRGIALREKNVMPLVIQSEIERLMPGGSAERNRLRTFDCGADVDCFQLFLQEGGSNVGGNGDACRGIDQQMLLRAFVPRSASNKISTADNGADADARGVICAS